MGIYYKHRPQSHNHKQNMSPECGWGRAPQGEWVTPITSGVTNFPADFRKPFSSHFTVTCQLQPFSSNAHFPEPTPGLLQSQVPYLSYNLYTYHHRTCIKLYYCFIRFLSFLKHVLTESLSAVPLTSFSAITSLVICNRIVLHSRCFFKSLCVTS